MSYTFDVGKVEISNAKIETRPSENILKEEYVGTEACSSGDIFHFENAALVDMTRLAFNNHLPLVIDPDLVWVTITHGLAKHINFNAESLRDKFVDFKGKETLTVEIDDFVKGDPNNPWPIVFPQFSDKIAKFIGDKRDLLVCGFSTTTPIKKTISEIVLMDAMRSYFSYRCMTMCGIPRVTLEGTVEDWQDIRSRIDKLGGLELDWWFDKLKPVLDEFVSSSSGNPNIDFWKSFYNEGGGSGGPFISGKVICFYPYIGSKNTRNEFKGGYSYTPSYFKSTVSKVSFVWNYFGKVFPMEFIGGIIGGTQDSDGAIHSAYSWAVREASIPLSEYAAEELIVGLPVHDDKFPGQTGTIENIVMSTWSKNRIDNITVKWKDESKTYQVYDLNSLYTKGSD